MKKIDSNNFFSVSRVTGIWYLALAITGILAFLFVRAELYVPQDAVQTTNNFIAQAELARLGIASELALVGFQALAALWFFKLFRKIDSFASISLLVFGTVNAVGILIATVFWLSSVTLANSGGEASSVLMLFDLHESVWILCSLFFGLWLIPMGYLALKAKMPRALGWILIIGGFGYMLSSFLNVLSPELSQTIVEGSTVPATVGEFWMIGYLLFKKV